MESIKTIKMVMLLAAIMWGLSANLWADPKIKAVTTNSTLADLVSKIGSDYVRVSTIASPRQDIHHYAPTPKDVLKVKTADLLVHQGLDLEVWRGPLIDSAGNPRFFESQTGPYMVDSSVGVSLLEVPDSLSRSQGDIHLFGNPHYLSDPANYKIVAEHIKNKLVEMDPEHSEFYQKQAQEFERQIEEKLAEWSSHLRPFRGAPIVVYHRSWVYFAKQFGFEIAGEVEPKPGISPTAKHLAELLRVMREKKVKVIIREPFQESGSPEKIAKEADAMVVTLSQAVGEPKGAKDVFQLWDDNVMQLEKAFKAFERKAA